MKTLTQFPLGVMAGGPDGSNEIPFQSQFTAFSQLMGTTPQFMDGFIDPAQPIVNWAANASWTAWSWQQSSSSSGEIPVIGLPMTTYADAANPDADYKAFASGQYDNILRGIVQAWVAHGFSTMDFRVGYEMNSPSMAWYAGGDAATQADWVAAFQHISTVLHSVAGADVKVVWNPNVQNWNPGGSVTALYPGNQYVDIIGADVYSPLYPRDLYDWALNNGTVDSSFAQWVANPINRMHYWSNPAANQWQPISDGAGNSFSLQNAIDFATAMGKPIAVAETAAGPGGNGSQDVTDDPAFPQWLAATLAHSTAPVAFVNIWDLNPGDGNWTFTGPDANKPLEAASWAANFGAVPTVATAFAAAVFIGNGPNSLTLNISEDAWQGDAQFTVSVDGILIGGVQTATASHAAGNDQAFLVQGNFGTGAHNVAVDFLNDAWGGTAAKDRNLYVDSAVQNGVSTPVGDALFTTGTQSFTVQSAASQASVVSIGAGFDSLTLSISEDAWRGDAQFTVSVDGILIGGVQIATASHAAHQDQAFMVHGNFAAGQHTVSVDFLNDAWGGTSTTDRNLYVDSATMNGTTSAVGMALMAEGNQSFTIGTVPVSAAPIAIGSGPDIVAVKISEDAWLGDAQFIVSMDGTQIGTVQTATASHALALDQTFTVAGNFGLTTHDLAIAFINDAWGGTSTTDRNLYVDNISYGGNSSHVDAALLVNGTQHFTTSPTQINTGVFAH